MDANLGTVCRFKQQTGAWIDARGVGTTEGYKGTIFGGGNSLKVA